MVKLTARNRNLVLVAAVLVLAAAIQLKSGPMSPKRTSLQATGRYYAGNQFHGTILGLSQDRFVEWYKCVTDLEPVTVSSGEYEISKDNLILRDEKTGTVRKLDRFEDRIWVDDYQTRLHFKYWKTQRSWDDLQSKDVIRYSMDGVRLGATLKDVEAVWGELEPTSFWGLRRSANSEQTILLDRFGHVESISGYRILKDQTLLLSRGERYARALELGRLQRRIYCGAKPMFRRTERIVGPCNIQILGLEPNVMEREYQDELRKMKPDKERMLQGIHYLNLSCASPNVE